MSLSYYEVSTKLTQGVLPWPTTTCANGSKPWKTPASSSASPKKFPPSSKSPKSLTASARSAQRARPSKGKAATKTTYASGGPALLFENVKGHPGHKVLINQFGSERRMAMSLGVKHLDEIAGRITALMNFKPPTGGLFDKLKMLPQLGALTAAIPKTVSAREAPLQAGHPQRQLRPQRLPHPQVLAARRRPLHHSALRAYPRSQIRQAQHRHVSHAGLRWPDHRHALAAPESRRRTLPQSHARCRSRRLKLQRKDRAHVQAMAESAGGAVSIPDGPIGGLPQVAFAKKRLTPRSGRCHRHRSRHHVRRHRSRPARD